MHSFVVVLLIALAACGGEDRPEGDCVASDSTRYLPYSEGYSWTYEVTDLVLQETTTKSQSVTGTMNHPDDGMPVFIQVTNKSSGRTESWVRQSGDALIRLQQVDYDADSVLERTTVYEPGKIRLDETAARIASGASFAENYTAIIFDEFGAEKSRTDLTEQWQVLSVGDPCPGADFADYDCLEIERARTGTPSKTFWFAAGIGKVREEGGQIEQLTACSLE
jgi:hypothetical protein